MTLEPHSYIRNLYPSMSAQSILSSSMADPFSMTVGIWAALQAVATIVEFIKSLKDAPKELKCTLDEIEALQNVLHQILELHNKSSDEHSTTQILLNSRLPLKECLLQLERLNKNLSR